MSYFLEFFLKGPKIKMRKRLSFLKKHPASISLVSDPPDLKLNWGSAQELITKDSDIIFK